MTRESRIRDPEQFAASVHSFSWLGQDGRGATDLDFFREYRGRFLVMEGKRWHQGLQVPMGQHLALAQLCQLSEFTVYLVGETDGDTFYLLEYGRTAPLHTNQRGAYYPGSVFTAKTVPEMRELVRAWERT